MRYSHIKQSIVEQFQAENGNKIVPFILGAPGCGKSACGRDVLTELDIPAERVIEFTASLRDAVDVMGTPNNTGDYTRWVPPEEFYRIRRGQGRCALLLEELSDAPVPMQNALCGVIYDRRAGQLQLSDELFIVATGNKAEHKSGAHQITSKLANRCREFTFTENIDDWTGWAIPRIDPVLIQFLRFRPGLLSDFKPDRFANPTARSWERVSFIPESLPPELFFDNVAGEVGEGAAAEYTGFRRIYQGLPDIQSILLDPARADVPTDPATLFALTGALAKKATKDNFDRVGAYLGRLPPEFNVMCIKDAIALQPAIKRCRAYMEWSTKHVDVLM